MGGVQIVGLSEVIMSQRKSNKKHKDWRYWEANDGQANVKARRKTSKLRRRESQNEQTKLPEGKE